MSKFRNWPSRRGYSLYYVEFIGASGCVGLGSEAIVWIW